MPRKATAKKPVRKKMVSAERESMYQEFIEPFVATRWVLGLLIMVSSLSYGFVYFTKPPEVKQLYAGKYISAGGEGHTHFVVIDKEFLNDRTMQSYAGRRICEQAGQLDYCEVYMFKDMKDVPPGLPIMRGKNDVVGMFKYEGENVKFRLLHDGGFNDATGARVVPKRSKYYNEQERMQ